MVELLLLVLSNGLADDENSVVDDSTYNAADAIGGDVVDDDPSGQAASVELAADDCVVDEDPGGAFVVAGFVFDLLSFKFKSSMSPLSCVSLIIGAFVGGAMISIFGFCSSSRQ